MGGHLPKGFASMELLHGHLMRYPWGTTDAIATILDITPDGEPLAEYWLGAHPAGPARLGGVALDESLATDPGQLGDACRAAFDGRLPFLVKILSARHALSVQVHPSRDQAREGFAAEESAGTPLASPLRVYRDDWPKPEILIALEEFHTLAGFRDPAATTALIEALGVAEQLQGVIGPLTRRHGEAGLQEVFLDILSRAGDASLVEVLLAACVRHADDPGELGAVARTALELDQTFPGDPGILAALLLNRVTLAPGEAMYVPAGQLHAHLRGTGIEVMANSDNVVRGCLTSKHIAVDELVRIVDYTPTEPATVPVDQVSPGVQLYRTPCPEFDVHRLSPAAAEAAVPLPRPGTPRIALVTDGEAVFRDASRELIVGRGQAVFVGANDPEVKVHGAADVFVASPGAF